MVTKFEWKKFTDLDRGSLPAMRAAAAAFPWL
jgi:hypothetical protein